VSNSWSWGCPDCGGCVDDTCYGCDQRWCGGTYLGEGCDRCPEKVDKEGCPGAKPGQVVKVRCAESVGHKGIHHWDRWKAGR